MIGSVERDGSSEPVGRTPEAPLREGDAPTHLVEVVKSSLVAAALVALPAAMLWSTRTVWPRGGAHAWVEVHYAAVGLATLLGAAVMIVAIAGLRRDASAFRFYVAGAFLVETYLYAFHGLFTGVWEGEPALFLLYGPASRLAFGVLLWIAAYRLLRPRRVPTWRRSLVSMVGIATLAVVAIAAYATSPVAEVVAGRDRIVLEVLALGAMASAFALVLRTAWWRLAMLRYLLGALVLFCVSSVCFLVVERPFDATFWLAHGVFAAGFLLLGYGVVSVWTRSHGLGEVLDIASLETRLLEQQARRRYDERFRAVVGAIAHDQNNLMTAITGVLETRGGGPGALAGGADPVEESIRLATLRAKEMSRRMLALSGTSHMATSSTHLSTVLGEIVERWRRDEHRSVEIDDHLGRATVRIAPPYFGDALVALLDNARDATRADGSILVRAWVVPRGDGTATAHVAVIDDGHGVDGIDPAELTSLVGSSRVDRARMGLGLPFVARVVEGVGGRLELWSRAGRGFRATMVLPCHVEGTASTSSSASFPGRAAVDPGAP